MSFYLLNKKFYLDFYYLKSVVDVGSDLEASSADLQAYVGNLYRLIDTRGAMHWNLNFQPNQSDQPTQFEQLMDAVPLEDRSCDPTVLDRKYGAIPFRTEKFYCQNQCLLGVMAERKLIETKPDGLLVWHRITKNILASMSRKMNEEGRSLTAATAVCSGIELIGVFQACEAFVDRFGYLSKIQPVLPRLGLFGGCLVASNLIFNRFRQTITDRRREPTWL